MCLLRADYCIFSGLITLIVIIIFCEIDCSNNLLTSLPSSICQLTKLRIINCSYNLLDELSPGIGQLRKLEFLDCSHNHLKRMPHEIIRLRIYGKLIYLII